MLTSPPSLALLLLARSLSLSGALPGDATLHTPQEELRDAARGAGGEKRGGGCR